MAWSHLPDDLIELVLERLPPRDYLCFAAVCRPWREAQMAHRALCAPSPPRSTLRLPWLAMPSPGHEASALYSPFEGRLYRLPLPQHPWYGAPLQGWTTAVVAERFPYLFNPLTRAEIRLPELPQGFLFQRAFLSARPTDAAGCVVMVVNATEFALLWRVGSGPSGWTLVSLPVPAASCSDFVAVGGKFYGAAGHYSNLIVINPLPRMPEVGTVSNMVVLEHTTLAPVAENSFASPTWFMDCSGELVMVARRFLYSDGGVFYDFFKADLERRAWIRLAKLPGDMAVFLSTVSAVCIPNAQLGGAVRAGAGAGAGGLQRQTSRKRKADSTRSYSQLERVIPISSPSAGGRPVLNMTTWYTNQRDEVAIFDGCLYPPGATQHAAICWFMPTL